MHIRGQINSHHLLIICLRTILQCFCHLSASNTEGWCCCGIFWVIFKIIFLFTTEVRASMRTYGHHQSVKWRAGTVESCWNTVVDIQPKEDLDYPLWNLELVFQYLNTGIAEANRNISTDFSRSGGGPALVLIFYQFSNYCILQPTWIRRGGIQWEEG